MSEELKQAAVYTANVFLPGSLGPVRREVVLAYEHDRVVDQLREELDALKAGHGEAVAWRDHSVNYAKGEKCPATIETLQAAWDRDQELMLDQKNEISELKETINQLRQKRSASAEARLVPVELMRRLAKRVMLRSQEEAHADACEELRALLAQSQEVKP